MTRRRPGFGRYLIAAFACAAIAAACTRPANQAGTPGDAGSGALTGATLDAATLAPPDKQVLRLVNPEPNFLDPQRASFADDVAIVKQLYRGLLYIDRTDPTRVIPAAAREVPSAANGGISADGKTYTLKLRSGLKWQDGSPLGARDFEFAIKRLFDPNLAGDYASFYFDIAGSEDYYDALGTKASPKNPSAQELARLHDAVGVRATDDSTLVIILHTPQPSFNSLLTLWPVSPVQKAQIDKFGDKAFADARNIAGNGPFHMTEWVHQDHITLEKNPNWWGDDKPYLSKIVMRDIEDDTVAFTAYKNGELDMTGVPLADVDVVRNDPVLSKENYRAGLQTTYGLEFNLTKPPFDDVNVRHAFSEAIDRDSFIKAVRRGVGKAAYSWLPPGVPDYDERLGQQYKFDAPKAKADLAKSKYGSNLPPVKLTVSNSASGKLQAEFIQQQLVSNIAAKVELEVLESAVYKSRFQRSDFQMVIGGWGSDYADPEDWIPDLFGTNGGNNKYKYSNSRVDELIKDALSTGDNDRRLKDYAQAQVIIVEDMPLAFVYYSQLNGLKKPYVQGVVPTGLDGLSDRGEAGDWFFTNIAIAKH